MKLARLPKIIGMDDGEDTIEPWAPADDDLLRGRVGRVDLVELVEAPKPVAVAAEPAAGLLMMPAAAEASDPDFWRRGLPPLPDFDDVRALPDRPLHIVD